ncbi:MAG TPA: hypothetical protein VIU29_01225 [Candidatus Deferrimicrobiaceae bacterium]
MGRFARRIFMVMAVLALVAGAAPAAEKKQTEKDLCLLYSEDCSRRALTLQEKIARLQQEIAKGTRTYTPEELRRLEEKLKEAERYLNDLLYSPSRH